jgi:hypothetical protein
MSVSGGPIVSRSLVARVKGILLSPSAEWQLIESEPATTGGLYAGYIVPLSAIGPIAGAIGLSLFGISVPFVGRIHSSLTWVLEGAVLGYIFGLLGVYVTAFVVDALAPTFGGEKNMVQSLKVVAYSFTAAWVAGILRIVPALGILVVLASLYSLYVFYLGLPILKKSPPDKALGYSVVSIVCAIIVNIVIGAVTAAIIGGAAYSTGALTH